jgi:hypothetical protein
MVFRVLIYTANQLTRPFQTESIDYEGIGILLPRIFVADRTVLEFLTYDFDLLVVLLTVFPLLDVVDTVAVGALDLLHGGAIYGVHELH